MFRFIINLWSRFQMNRFARAAQNPQKIYEKKWRKLLRIKSKHFSGSLRLNSRLEVLRELPFTTYEDYKEQFENSLISGRNELINEEVFFWATSTGTSGAPKLFPLSRSVHKERLECSPFIPAQLIKWFDVYSGAPEIILVMPGDKQAIAPNRKSGQIGYYYYSKIPAVLEKKFIFPKALYANKEQFDQWHLLSALLSDAKGIATTVPSRIHHLVSQIDANRIKLRNQLLDDDWPQMISQWKNQERIEYVIEVLNSPIHRITDLWPAMRFIACWKAGEACGRQLRELKAAYDFSNISFVDNAFSSSEAVFNLPMRDEIGGPIMPYGSLLEFIHNETKEVFWPWELVEGEIYEVVITNAMGLKRYRTSDLVICTGYFENIAKIAFHSRTQLGVSLGWANVEETTLVNALEKVGIEKHVDLFFSLNASGNGLVLYSQDQETIAQSERINAQLELLNQNYKEQILIGTVIPLVGQHCSKEEFNRHCLNNVNVKGLLYKTDPELSTS